MATASFGYFGMSVETTEGTEVAPSRFIPVKDVDFPLETDFIEVREIKGSRQAYSMFDGPVRSSVTFTSSFYPDLATGMLFRGLYGSSTNVATGPSVTARTTTFADAAVLPTYTFERVDNKTTGQGFFGQRLGGAKIESIGVSCTFGEDVEISVSAQAAKSPIVVPSKTVPVYSTYDPYIFTGATISLDGVASNYFKSIDFEFTNTLERQEALRGTREAYKMFEGGITCTLSGTLVFEDISLYTKYRNSEYMTVTCVFQGAQIASDGAGSTPIYNKARFHWPKVKISSMGLPFTAGEVIEADVEFQVMYDTATSSMCDIQLTNLDAHTIYTSNA